MEGGCKDRDGLGETASCHGSGRRIRRGDCPAPEESGLRSFTFLFAHAPGGFADQSRVGAAAQAKIAARAPGVGSNRGIPSVPRKGGAGPAESCEPGGKRASRSRYGSLHPLCNSPRLERRVGRPLVPDFLRLFRSCGRIIPVHGYEVARFVSAFTRVGIRKTAARFRPPQNPSSFRKETIVEFNL